MTEEKHQKSSCKTVRERSTQHLKRRIGDGARESTDEHKNARAQRFDRARTSESEVQ